LTSRTPDCIALLPKIGFEIPGLVLLVLWLKVLGGESWLCRWRWAHSHRRM